MKKFKRMTLEEIQKVIVHDLDLEFDEFIEFLKIRTKLRDKELEKELERKELEKIKCNACGKNGQYLEDLVHGLCGGCKAMYEWQYDRKILFKDRISYEDFISGVILANKLAPEGE